MPVVNVWAEAQTYLEAKALHLHAVRLELAHPRTGKELRAEAPLPAELVGFLAELRG